MIRFLFVLAFGLLTYFFCCSRLNAEVGVVRAAHHYWQFQRWLEPNCIYVIIPDANSRVSISGGMQNDFHGTATVHSSKTYVSEPKGIGREIQLGGLFALVQHRLKEGDEEAYKPQFVSFPKGMDFALIRVGRHGAALNFLIIDYLEKYDDNSGHCHLRLEKDDGSGKVIRPLFPIAVNRGPASWTIDARGTVTGSLAWSAAKGKGFSQFASGIVVEFFDGTTYTEEMSISRNRDQFRDRQGTEFAILPSIPSDKVHQIRRVYATHSIDQGSMVLSNWKDTVLKGIIDPISDEALKNLGLVPGAVKLSVLDN